MGKLFSKVGSDEPAGSFKKSILFVIWLSQLLAMLRHVGSLAVEGEI